MKNGMLHALVNNAATQKIDSTANLSLQDFHESQVVNVCAPFALVKSFLTDLTKTGGAVVNISSIHSSLTKPQFVAYASSKAGLTGLTNALAVDIGAMGVKTFAIEPAAIDTDMLRSGFSGNPEALAKLNEYHPTMKIGQPEEVAGITSYLINGASSFLNGSVIKLTGGIHGRLHDPD